jgi:photosystem I P700 chlorophyll a apoprotein A1
MHFHGAYFSNYGAWLKDAKHCPPAIAGVSSLTGSSIFLHQDILDSSPNSSPYYFQGLRILSGFFQLWRSEGLVTAGNLKAAAAVAASAAVIILVGGAYFHMHVSPANRQPLSLHHLSILAGLGSIAWSGHQFHISTPLNLWLSAGVSPSAAEAVFSKDLMEAVGVDWPLLGKHHFYVGVVLIVGGVGSQVFTSRVPAEQAQTQFSFHGELARNLGILGSLSAAYSLVIASAAPVYPLLASDYPTLLALVVHHLWIAGFIMLGSGAHASIYCLSDYGGPTQERSSANRLFETVLKHRDIIVCHLIWACLFLGLHSFGLYIHNDTMQSLGRPQDTFGDNSIQLKPI